MTQLLVFVFLYLFAFHMVFRVAGKHSLINSRNSNLVEFNMTRSKRSMLIAFAVLFREYLRLAINIIFLKFYQLFTAK